MDEILIYISIATLLALILGYFVLFNKKKEKSDEGVARPRRLPPMGAAAGDPTRAAPNRAAANRNARARMRAAQTRREASDDENEEELDAISETMALPDGKIGKKKQAKLAAKAEKKANREAEEREREERKERDEKIAEMKKKEEDEKEELEKEKEERERIEREEKERREQEEYEKMKAAFAVEEEGFDEGINEEKERDLYNEFINHIKREKVVVLEDLASRFKIKTQAAINRINDMQSDGTLTGVIDDRGKFIYISMSELENLAKFIKQRGRVSITELSEASNSLITLTPETQVIS